MTTMTAPTRRYRTFHRPDVGQHHRRAAAGDEPTRTQLRTKENTDA